MRAKQAGCTFGIGVTGMAIGVLAVIPMSVAVAAGPYYPSYPSMAPMSRTGSTTQAQSSSSQSAPAQNVRQRSAGTTGPQGVSPYGRRFGTMGYPGQGYGYPGYGGYPGQYGAYPAQYGYPGAYGRGGQYGYPGPYGYPGQYGYTGQYGYPGQMTPFIARNYGTPWGPGYYWPGSTSGYGPFGYRPVGYAPGMMGAAPGYGYMGYPQAGHPAAALARGYSPVQSGPSNFCR